MPYYTFMEKLYWIVSGLKKKQREKTNTPKLLTRFFVFQPHDPSIFIHQRPDALNIKCRDGNLLTIARL